jgi:integrase
MKNRNSSGGFDTAVTAFLTHQRTLGRSYRTVEYELKALHRFLTRRRADDLSSGIFNQWFRAQRHLSANTRYARQLIVRRLCLYRQRSEPACFVPDLTSFARRQPSPAPVLIRPQQIARMLHVASALSGSPKSPLRPAILRLAVVLLYTSGLRRGELVRLRIGDVDAQAGVLHIHESKFHRSRLVPLSVDARRELHRYLRQRLAPPFDRRSAAPLLCNRAHSSGCAGWHAYTGDGLAQGIHMLFDLASVRDIEGRRPRVHDIRHNFALHALLRWYRRGEDVQSCLPKLALYMGHVSIVSTAYYLRLIPEVAALASKRFGQHFSHLIEAGAS